MRKVTQQIIRAWADRQTLTVGNTHTDGQTIFLHGNAIVWRTTDKRFKTTLAGWNTVTTRERLNGVLNFYGIPDRFAQRNFEPVLVHGLDLTEIGDFERIEWDMDWQCEAGRADNLALMERQIGHA